MPKNWAIEVNKMKQGIALLIVSIASIGALYVLPGWDGILVAGSLWLGYLLS